MDINVEELRTIETNHEHPITSIKYRPDGNWIASSSADGRVHLFDVETGTLITKLEGHALGINDLCWNNDGNVIVTASDDKSILVWDVRESKIERKLTGHTNYVFTVDISSNGNLIASGSFDESVRYWSIENGDEIYAAPGHSDPVTCVRFANDSDKLYSSSFDGTIRCWSEKRNCTNTFLHENTEDANPAIACIGTPKNKQFVISSSLSSRITLWDVSKSEVIRDYYGHTTTKYCGTIDTVSGKIVSGSENNDIFIWCVDYSSPVSRVVGHKGPVIAINTHPKIKKVFGSGSFDKTIKLWRLEDKKKE